MTDHLAKLKHKADHLWRRLRFHGFHFPRKQKENLFAYILGEGDWRRLSNFYKKHPGPLSRYQPSAELLAKITQIPLDKARSILAEVRWPETHVPIFNRLRFHIDGSVILPTIFKCSHLFSYSRKRKKNLLQRRVALFDFEDNMSRDFILYSGDELNHYDESVLTSLLYTHPEEIPVGREFDFSENDFSPSSNHSFSPESFEKSLLRMKTCRIDIRIINFFGPLISDFRKIKTPRKTPFYRIALNPEITKFYLDGLYGWTMDSANLFHYKPDNECKQYDYRTMKRKLEDSKSAGYDNFKKSLEEDWPTKKRDVAAIFAIIAKNAKGGKVDFKLLEDAQFLMMTTR